jgi:hypothetical protein
MTGFYEKDNVEYLNHYELNELDYHNFLNGINTLIKDDDINIKNK